MDPATRAKMGNQAIDLAKACGYYSTGTVEFLMDHKKDFYFLQQIVIQYSVRIMCCIDKNAKNIIKCIQ